jgi:hypothetical protein
VCFFKIVGHSSNRPALQRSRSLVIQAQAFGHLFLRRKVASMARLAHGV